MILFQAVKRHILGENFKLEMLQENDINTKYYNLLKMFMDNCPLGPISNVCPFGIHSICCEGKINNIKPGEWYGP